MNQREHLQPRQAKNEPNSDFIQPQALQLAKESEEDQVKTSDSEVGSSPKGNDLQNNAGKANSVVRPNALVQAKKEQQQAETESPQEDVAKKEESTAKSSSGSTTKNEENSDERGILQRILYKGTIRTFSVQGTSMTISPFTDEESDAFAYDESEVLIYMDKTYSIMEFLSEIFQPEIGIKYVTNVLRKNGSTAKIITIWMKTPEQEAALASEQSQSAKTPEKEDKEAVVSSEQEVTSQPSNQETISTPEKVEAEKPKGPYWKHEWHVDRFGKESLFIWEVGGKRWHGTADAGFAYIRKMVLKQPGDDGYDPKFTRYAERPNIHKDGVDASLNWWFKKSPGWDDPQQKDDGTADFQDLAEFKDVTHNKKGTGFRYVAYSFDPEIYEKLAAIEAAKAKEKADQERAAANEKFIANHTNYQGYVSAPNGIILHDTPDPNDTSYQEKSDDNNPNKQDFVITQDTPVTIIAEGNKEAEGWVMVRTSTGAEGWIERRYISKKPTVAKKHPFPVYHVESGDTLEEVINDYYANYGFSTGNDRRTVALAIYLYNKNKPGAGIYRNASKWNNYVNSWEGMGKSVADPWMVETRANYQSVELYAGGDVYLPPKWYIDKMRESGQVEKRPDFVNDMIEVGRVVEGFLDGVGEGFFDAAVGAVEDLWDMIKSIFTGEIFGQIADMFETLWDMGFEGIWDAIKGFASGTYEEMKAAWNNPNPYQRGKYFGEIIGMILFEVVLAIFTAGAGSLIRQSARVQKIMKVLPKLKKIKAPKNVSKHKDELEDLAKKLNKKDGPDVKKKKPDVDATDAHKINTPESSKKYEKEISESRRKELEYEAQSEINKDSNLKDKKDSDEYKKKLAALATAKIITEGADVVGLPINTLNVELSFLEKLPEVRDFEFNGSAGVYKVYMIGSKFLVDGKYTESGDGKYRVLGKSKNGTALQDGDSRFGWKHIIEGHIDGKPGKTMFPKGISKNKVKELILDASDGKVLRSQGDRKLIHKKFKPAKYGVSEIEVWVNTSGNFIETAYPTAGPSVWTFPKLN